VKTNILGSPERFEQEEKINRRLVKITTALKLAMYRFMMLKKLI